MQAIFLKHPSHPNRKTAHQFTNQEVTRHLRRRTQRRSFSLSRVTLSLQQVHFWRKFFVHSRTAHIRSPGAAETKINLWGARNRKYRRARCTRLFTRTRAYTRAALPFFFLSTSNVKAKELIYISQCMSRRTPNKRIYNYCSSRADIFTRIYYTESSPRRS